MKKIIPFICQVDITIQENWLNVLKKELTNYEVILHTKLTNEQLFECEVAIVANPHPEVFSKMPKLKWVQSLWAGVERLLLEVPASKFEIVRMADLSLANTMAQSVLAWTFYLYKNMPLYQKQQSQKVWKEHILEQPEDKNIVILGLGNLGKKSALKLLENDFNVFGWSRSKKEIEGIKTYCGNDGLEQVLKIADIVVCLLPLTKETTNLIDSSKLKLLKKGSSIINFAREPIIDYDALVKSIQDSHISHAVLDVFKEEPLNENSALWDNPNITILPHISAPTNMKTAAKLAASNISDYFYSGKLPTFVDKKSGY